MTDDSPPPSVWIFHGAGAAFASGVFANRDDGMAWIARHRLTGILTEYPVGDGCYDLAVRAGQFNPSKPHHGTPQHVAGFSPNRTEHIHVRDGHDDRHYSELLRPTSQPTDRGSGDAGADRSADVQGWVGEDHVVEVLQRISTYIGYRYDDLDEAALTGALDETDDESADGWFAYPLQGTPPLLVHLAQSRGSAVVMVRIEGAIDAVLAAQIETLFDLL
jgi:hypothetical protein